MNCWTHPGRPLGRGSRDVVAAPTPLDVREPVRAEPRLRRRSAALYPGEQVLLVRRRRELVRAFVVHVAERWARRRGATVPMPYHAPPGRRLVAVAVEGEAGWQPRVVNRQSVRSSTWAPPEPGMSWTRAELHGQAGREQYAWRALEERMPWMVGECPAMEELRLEARRLGAVYGYPGCCSADYAARMPDVRPSEAQLRAAQGGDFVPCPRCADRVCRARADLAPFTLRALVADRLYPGALQIGTGPLELPEPSALALRTRTYCPCPSAWRALVDARARRVEAGAVLMQLRSGGRRGQPVLHPLPRAAEAQAIMRHMVDRETRLIDSLRWLLTERRPPSAKKPPTPRGGRRPW